MVQQHGNGNISVQILLLEQYIEQFNRNNVVSSVIVKIKVLYRKNKHLAC